MDTSFEASMSTEVLATSFFRNDAEMKTRLALIDGFGEVDEARLEELLGNNYTPFTEDELAQLKNVSAVIIDDEFFQDYTYLLDTQSEVKMTNFYNPETLKNNHWLHTKKVVSTSPFKDAVVFTSGKPAVNSVTISPAESTISAGLSLQLAAEVSTSNFANKAVLWTIEQSNGDTDTLKATITLDGLLQVPAGYNTTGEAPQIKVKATSIYDNTISGEATITVV